MQRKTHLTTVRLSDDELAMVKALGRHWGLRMADVIRHSLIRSLRAEGLGEEPSVNSCTPN